MKDNLVYYADMWVFIKKRKKKWLVWSMLGALLGGMGALVSPPTYVIEASFKEAQAPNDSSSTHLLKALLKSPTGSDSTTPAITMMRSRQFLSKAIEKSGLQVEIKTGSWKERLFPDKAKGKERLCTAHYAGEAYQKWKIEFFSEQEVRVSSLDGKRKFKQSSASSFRLGEASIELQQKKIPVGENWLVVLEPMQVTLEKLKKKMKLKSGKQDSGLLELSYKDTNPHRGAYFLNTLMQDYKKYLVQENERIAGAQLHYLTKRQEEIAMQLDTTLQQHVQYLQKTLGDKGFMSLHQELELMENKKKKQQQRLMEIDVDIEKLSRIKKEKLFCYSDPVLGQEAQSYQQRLLGLKQQQKCLDSELVASKRQRFPGWAWQGGSSELLEERLVDPLVFFPMRDHLKEKKRHLERCFNAKDLKRQSIPLEFRGMDLVAARKLQEEYIHELDLADKGIVQWEAALDSLENSSFEPSQLLSFVEDGVSQELVKDMMQATGALKQEKYFSERDRARLQEEFLQKKGELHAHLAEKKKLAAKYGKNARAKLSSLQETIALLVYQEMQLLEKQMEELVSERLATFQAEKGYIQAKLEDMQKDMQGIPHKWLVENKLQLQSDMHIGIMEAMAQLVESKNVQHHLVQVESKVIDEAYVPLKSRSRHAALIALLGAIVTLMTAMAISLGKRVYKGFPLSLQGLEDRGLVVAGFAPKAVETLEKVSSGDLETLRKIAAFVTGVEGKMVGVILNHTFDYTFHLKNLLERMGQKVACVPLVPEGAQYFVETMHHKEFREKLKTLEKDADKVLLVLSQGARTAEAYKLKDLCRALCVTVVEESLGDLSLYLEWERNLGRKALMYVVG